MLWPHRTAVGWRNHMRQSQGRVELLYKHLCNILIKRSFKYFAFDESECCLITSLNLIPKWNPKGGYGDLTSFDLDKISIFLLSFQWCILGDCVYDEKAPASPGEFKRCRTFRYQLICNVFRLNFLPWSKFCSKQQRSMMTSSNGSIFRVTGPLWVESTGHRWFPSQRPATRSFDLFFDLHLNKRSSKQSRCWVFETPSHSLWRHCNEPTALFPT